MKKRKRKEKEVFVSPKLRDIKMTVTTEKKKVDGKGERGSCLADRGRGR